ncbi:MAG TPA: cytochrome c3 family protein [Gemmatimonadota bacterium]|nr:cytochrome c3 family protein [Gemmatimonadota bacterium]
MRPRRSWIRWLPAGGATLLALLGAATASLPGAPPGAPPGSGQPEPTFPHARHAGLFPTCLGCHEGIPSGDTALFFSVGQETCSRCHDGVEQVRVSLPRPSPRASNLAFSHPRHIEEASRAGEASIECQACHRTPGSERRMEVAGPRPELCVGCHAHRAPSHLASDRCRGCHRPLAEATTLPAALIADFPRPRWHERPDFILVGHGERASRSVASCSVCHARESCSRCHLNGAALDPVRALAPDSRVAGLVSGRAGEWPAPPSHAASGWEYLHGERARAAIGTCANCHAAASCAACHGSARTGPIAELPRAIPGGPSGARVRAAGPPGHGPRFRTGHGIAAGARLPRCSSCHVETECAACHDASVSGGGMVPGALARPDRHGRVAADTSPGSAEGDTAAGRAAGDTVRTPPPVSETAEPPPAGPRRTGDEGAAWAEGLEGGFHPMDFVLRHGAAAFGRRVECSECHSSEAFCRSCHERQGRAAENRQVTQAFHDAEPDWLLAHGRAARQGLDECASCHRQSSCLRCHSARAGLRIDPHGPDFDPDRIAGRSVMSCGICHTKEQVLRP